MSAGTADSPENGKYEDPNTGSIERDLEETLDQNSYYWFELDDPNSQFDFPKREPSLDDEGYDIILGTLNYISNSKNDASNQFTEDVRAVYITFIPLSELPYTPGSNDTPSNQGSSEVYSLNLVPVSRERDQYDSGASPYYQVIDAGDHSSEVLSRFLDENVVGASDVSKNMPQRYLDLVG
jgi:hypothetical protein